MNFLKKILIITCIVSFVNAQGTSRSKAKRIPSSSVNTKIPQSALSADEQGRTLGLLRPILRLGLGGLRRTGTGAGALSDPTYGGSYGGYAGYPASNSVYGNYANYAGLNNGVGFDGGYRPPVAQPAYNNYNTGYAGSTGTTSLGNLGSFAFGNSAGTAYAPTNTAVGSGANSAQQAQLATALGQALGSSLRPLLSGGNAGRFGTSAISAAPAAASYGASSNPFVGLFGLFG